MPHDDRNMPQSPKMSPRSRTTIALTGFFLVATFFLLSEHRAHVVEWLPWLILLACPLLHVFMHRGHGGGHKHG